MLTNIGIMPGTCGLEYVQRSRGRSTSAMAIMSNSNAQAHPSLVLKAQSLVRGDR